MQYNISVQVDCITNQPAQTKSLAHGIQSFCIDSYFVLTISNCLVVKSNSRSNHPSLPPRGTIGDQAVHNSIASAPANLMQHDRGAKVAPHCFGCSRKTPYTVHHNLPMPISNPHRQASAQSHPVGRSLGRCS